MSSSVDPRSRREAFRTRLNRSTRLGFVLLLLVTALPVQAGDVQVTLMLPVRARIDLTDRSTVTVAPFLVVSDEGEETAARRGVDVEPDLGPVAADRIVDRVEVTLGDLDQAVRLYYEARSLEDAREAHAFLTEERLDLDPVLTVGLDEIDDDHSKLIDLANLLNHSIAEGAATEYRANQVLMGKCLSE